MLNISIKSTKSDDRFYPAVLLFPLIMYGKFYKGVIWVCFPDRLIRNYPDVKKYFIVISTSAWFGWSHTSVEDIHALTVESDIGKFKKEFPNREYIVLHDGDFISEDDYYPIGTNKEYDVIFVSRTVPYKRHHVFIKIMYILKKQYHRDIKALVIATPDYVPKRFFNIFKSPLSLRNTVTNMKHELYEPIIKLLYKKAIMEGLNITLVTKYQNIESLRSFYSQSKMYLLLSKFEGVNRTAKETLLCNTPIMTIQNTATAEAYVNHDTGKAVVDDLDAIARGIVDMLDNYTSYSPREWFMRNQLRRTACEKLWGKINSIQRFPGYPDIDAASDIRRHFTENKGDNYIDLNYFKGHYGPNAEFFNPVFFDEAFTKIREKFKKYV